MLNALKCMIWTQEIRLLFHNKEEEKNGNITRWDKCSDKKNIWNKLYMYPPRLPGKLFVEQGWKFCYI